MEALSKTFDAKLKDSRQGYYLPRLVQWTLAALLPQVFQRLRMNQEVTKLNEKIGDGTRNRWAITPLLVSPHPAGLDEFLRQGEADALPVPRSITNEGRPDLPFQAGFRLRRAAVWTPTGSSQSD